MNHTQTFTPAGRLITVPCRQTTEAAIAALTAELGQRGIPVFGHFDHGRNAAEAGLPLRPTQVLVFGAPAVGTKLMQENQQTAIELPLRIAVWEDAQGQTQLAYPNLQLLAEEYGLTETSEIVEKMQLLLSALAAAVC